MCLGERLRAAGSWPKSLVLPELDFFQDALQMMVFQSIIVDESYDFHPDLLRVGRYQGGKVGERERMGESER